MRILVLCTAVLFCAAGFLCAQDVGSIWGGEWGAFQATNSVHGAQYSGAGVSISDCAAERCEFAIQVVNRAGHGEAKGFLAFQSSTQAIAHLVAFSEEHCTLQLTLSVSGAEIVVTPGVGDCSYFQTPGVKFEGRYLLHNRDHYVSDDIPGCFTAASSAKLALCRSEQLTEQQTRWEILYLQVEELSEMSTADELNRESAAQSALLAGCEHAAQSVVDGCLREAFSKSRHELEARMNAWHDSMTEPGDPAVAKAKAKEVAGRYRRSFANGDVDGDQFKSTDMMTITALKNGVVGFKLHLEFYNGHECNLEGKASYARAGAFVYEKEADTPQAPECVFEIVPEKGGVKLMDQTSGCKLMSCGERGGYIGEGFTSKERY